MTFEPKVSRYFTIDILKILAIIAIVFLHIFEINFKLKNALFPIRPYILLLSSGMQIFFFASGWLTANTIREYKKTHTNWRQRFLLRRFIRIYPLFFTFLIINWLLSIYLPNYCLVCIQNFSKSQQYLSFFAEAFFVANLNPHILHAFFDGSWSISLEVLFYLFMAYLGHKLLGNLKNTVRMASFSIAILVIVKYYFYLNNVEGYTYYQFSSQLTVFLFGVITSELKLSRTDDVLSKFLPIFILLLLGSFKMNTEPLYPHIYFTFFLMITSLSINEEKVYSYIIRRRRLSNALIAVSNSTYAIFLLHLVLLKYLNTLDHMSLFEVTILSILLGFVLPLVFSVFILNPLESHLIRRLTTSSK